MLEERRLLCLFEEREKRLNKQLSEMQEKKKLYDKEQEIRSIRNQMRHWHPPTTTKILMAYIFINCTVIEIYSMVAMWRLEDLSALYCLITAVVGETISFAVYAAKAYNETKQEELIRLERDKLEVGDNFEDTEPERLDAMG